MSDLPGKSISFEQIYPGVGSYRLNTCYNPDCRSFGAPPIDRGALFAQLRKEGKTAKEIEAVIAKQVGLYSIHSGEKNHRRTIHAFLYKSDEKSWVDRRRLKCSTRLPGGDACNASSPIFSDAHLEEEIRRLRNANGVLDGAICPACARRYLDAPQEFSLHGTHKRTKDRNGKPLKARATTDAVRVIHSACPGG
jgi:hypothetical protein